MRIGGRIRPTRHVPVLVCLRWVVIGQGYISIHFSASYSDQSSSQGLASKSDRKEADAKYLVVSRFDEAVHSVISQSRIRRKRTVLLIYL